MSHYTLFLYPLLEESILYCPSVHLSICPAVRCDISRAIGPIYLKFMLQMHPAGQQLKICDLDLEVQVVKFSSFFKKFETMGSIHFKSMLEMHSNVILEVCEN